MAEFVFEASHEEDTGRLAHALAKALPSRGVVALCGTLGAGKTYFVKRFAEACGVERSTVVSPTFVLMQHYQGQRTIHHIDAYRIADDDEFIELSPDEYFETEAVTFIEWADRVERCLPEQYLRIDIDARPGSARTFRLRSIGDACAAVVEAVKAALGNGD